MIKLLLGSRKRALVKLIFPNNVCLFATEVLIEFASQRFLLTLQIKQYLQLFYLKAETI